MAIEDITNYIQVSERIASSGQPEEMQFKDIANAGFQVVINLVMPDSENAIAEEGYIVTTRKMQYIHLPIPFDAPTAQHLRDFFLIMEAVREKKIWLHCVVNYRVSAFLFQYMRIVENYSDKEAEKVILKTWKPNKIWTDFMQIPKDKIIF